MNLYLLDYNKRAYPMYYAIMPLKFR